MLLSAFISLLQVVVVLLWAVAIWTGAFAFFFGCRYRAGYDVSFKVVRELLSQPQNIHRMVLTKKGEVVPPGEAYPGFYEHYASQVARLDACFGEFVKYLKLRDLYDKSIVILTSDHGESLNEEGRWGHNYWMFPEIVRITLIVHLPAEMRRTMFCDPAAVSFSTDITPSLYRLLGHAPIVRHPVFGRPLFTATEKEQQQHFRPAYLVASSYGAVYASSRTMAAGCT